MRFVKLTMINRDSYGRKQGLQDVYINAEEVKGVFRNESFNETVINMGGGLNYGVLETIAEVWRKLEGKTK